MLSGAKPSLYNFQNLLPSLPVPPLKETCDKFLLSVKALVSKERCLLPLLCPLHPSLPSTLPFRACVADNERHRYAELEKKCEEFQKKSGWRIQLYLLWRRMTTNSWLWEWWEKYVYLKVPHRTWCYARDLCGPTLTLYCAMHGICMVQRVCCMYQLKRGLGHPNCPQDFAADPYPSQTLLHRSPSPS